MDVGSVDDKLTSIELDGIEFYYVFAPHLNHDEDGRVAYIDKVRSLLEFSGSANNYLPAYPLFTADKIESEGLSLTTEIGAYWEGALYFLKTVLAQEDLLQAVEMISTTALEDLPDITWKMFSAIWNTHDQLSFLKAFLLREKANRYWGLDINYLASADEIRELANNNIHKDQLEWLAGFIDDYKENGDRFPNPYFGSSNPLHLGMILDQED